MGYPAKAYLLPRESRFRVLDGAHVDKAAVGIVKRLLPTATGLSAGQRAHLTKVLARFEKAAAAAPEGGCVMTECAGIPLVVEWPKGSTRTGTSSDGTAWSTEMSANYGFIPTTISRDREEVDFYGGDVPDPATIWVIAQIDREGQFDEFKLMIGFASAEDAMRCFCAHIPPEFMGEVFALPTELLRGLLGIEEDPACDGEGATITALELARDGDKALVALAKGASVIGAIRKLSVKKAVDPRTVRRGLAYAVSATWKGDAIPIAAAEGMKDHPALTMLPTEYYPNAANPLPTAPWLAAIEPPDESWIAFVAPDGGTLLWRERAADGGVIGTPVLFDRPDLAHTGYRPSPEVAKAMQKRVVKFMPMNDNDRTAERRIVRGLVLEVEPNGGSGDAHDETYSADVVENAAHGYLAYFRNLTDTHGQFLRPDQIAVVESFIAPCDYTHNGTLIRQGSWVIAIKVFDDVLWQAILAGEYRGFSIGGYAERIPNEGYAAAA